MYSTLYSQYNKPAHSKIQNRSIPLIAHLPLLQTTIIVTCLLPTAYLPTPLPSPLLYSTPKVPPPYPTSHSPSPPIPFPKPAKGSHNHSYFPVKKFASQFFYDEQAARVEQNGAMEQEGTPDDPTAGNNGDHYNHDGMIFDGLDGLDGHPTSHALDRIPSSSYEIVSTHCMRAPSPQQCLTSWLPPPPTTRSRLFV